VKVNRDQWSVIRSSIALLAVVMTARAADAPKLELTIDNLMRGPALYGYAPQSLRWAPDGKHLYFGWKERTEPIEKDYGTWVVDRDGRNLRRFSDDERRNAPPNNGRWTRDRNRALFVDDGDVMLYDGAINQSRYLTRTTESESNPRWTKDEKHVTFVRSNNLFELSLMDGDLVQLTNVAGPDEKGPQVDLWEEKDKKKSASQIWIEKEERKLIDTVDRRAKKREEDEARKKREHPLKPFKLEAKQMVSDLQLSPDGRSVIATIRTESQKGKRTIVPDYVTESAYADTIPSRQKVGDDLGATKLVRLDAMNGESKEIDFGLPGKPAGETPAVPTESKPAGGTPALPAEAKTEAAKSREVGIEEVTWSEDGSKAVVILRAVDNKDRWIVALDPVDAKTRTIVALHDDAWVNNFRSDDAGWLKDNDTFWYLSDESGYSHLYSVPWSGGTPKALTSGKWEVISASLSRDGKWFELQTSEESPFDHHIYRMPVAGGARTRVTTEAGFHESPAFSPDGTQLAEVYSYTNKPPEVFLRALNGNAMTRVTTSPAPEFAAYPWLDVPIVRVPSRDGAELPARFYKPAHPNGAAVIFVHGAGYLQNVIHGWSSYEHEFMFHHFLMEHGYTIIDVDYRGSAGYGRNWRTAIYRRMGGQDLDDQVDAAKWLVANHAIDAKRIGIYGGSYGGFITLMAMFTTPGTFAAGAALRPVTDWAAYNSGYTSNILNNPQRDPDAYRKSSPIYFAEGLKGALLICHGVVDTNVHFQDSVRLAQRLIELHKENWELAMFPMENHGFIEAASWADEYKRIYKLFERNIGR
jgi:dipeptidyl aminopeptidase/acylaminoacyl peptidase